MAKIMKDAAYMALPMNIKRGNPIPLDTTAVWYDKTEMETYAQSGATAYVGQILTFYGDVPVGDTGTTKKVCEAYMIADANGTLTKLAQTTASGDLATDVTNLQTAVAECLRSIESSDNSIDFQITDIANNGGKQADIKVKLSTIDGNNILELKDDGLYVPTPTIPTVPVYTLKKDTTASSGASATYHLLKDNVKVGDAIDIPKDMVVESGAVKTYATKTEATTDGMPADQANKETFPGTFIKLTIANKTSDSLFINAGGLIEYVTSGSKTGDMIVIEVSKDHKVTGTISDKTITKEKLIEAVQTSLGKADSAVQTVETGATNGHIKVDGTDVKVKGLDTAAYTTVDTLNATAQSYATTAKTEANQHTDDKIGELGDYAGGTPHTVKSYVDAKIANVNSSISTINTTLASKADTATTLAGYGIGDAYTKKEVKAEIDANSTADQAYADGIVGTAKEALIGATGDSVDKDTIHGAKKYADSKASTAESNAKTYADGLVSDTSAIGVKVKALEDTHAKVGGTGEDKDKFKTVAQEVQDGITALDLGNTYAKKTELPTYDDKSITKNGSKVEIKGFTEATNATFPQKNADGTIHWVPASEMSVATDGKTITKNGSNQLTLGGNFASIETATKETEYLFSRIMSDNTLKWTSIRPMASVEFEKFEDGVIEDGVEGIGIKLQGWTDAKIGAIPYKSNIDGSTGWKLKWKLPEEVDAKSLETTGGDESTPAKYQLKGFNTATNGQEPRINIDDKGNRTLTWVDNKDQAITNINTKFDDYYLKTETYSKDQVDNAINTKVASTYKPAGSIDAEAVSIFVPAEKYLGNVYNVSEQFTTTANFVEGAGKTYPAGTNIVVVKAVDNSYKFDVLAGFVDLSPYAKTTDLANKVDKVTGKDLSANDFTDALKTKLEGIATGAQVNYIKSVDTQFTVDTAGKLTLNAISPSKITGIDTYANKIETVKVGTTALTITDKTVTIPGATASALGVVKSSAKLNDVTVNADFTMTVNEISTDKLKQGQNTIIWNGGNASTT